MKRRLAAILAADIVGYSHLMNTDEMGTLLALKQCEAEIVEPTVSKYRGRIFKRVGDGYLVEFSSAVDCLECAMAWQKLTQEKIESLRFRIGINLGDVISEAEDVYGDGVNIAARIESLAEPGEIYLSQEVYHQVENKVKEGFADLGLHSVKNIEKPVHVYKVLPDKIDQTKGIAPPGTRPSFKKWVSAAAIALILALGLGGFYYKETRREFEPASVDQMSYPLPDRPSIVVMPFENRSDDQKSSFIAGGLTDDLTSALAKVPGLFVISKASAASYKEKPVDLKQVSEDQGVRYILGGSVQKADDKLRITTKLVDAVSGQYVWSDRFDGHTDDLFALQDEIVKKVIVELQVELTDGDNARIASRGTRSLEAWLLRLEGASEFFKFSQESMIRAREIYEQAHQADPNWSRPLALIASVNWYEAKRGWSSSKEESIRSGMKLARRSIEMDPAAPFGYQTMGNLYAVKGDEEKAIEYRRRAAELAPNDFNAVAGLATRLKDFGQEKEAVDLFEQAMRLSPKHPWWLQSGYGVALHLMGRKEEAIESFQTAITLQPNHIHPRAFLTAVYTDLGLTDEARKQAQEVLRIDPQFSATKFMISHTLHDHVRDTRFVGLLHEAGLPM